MSIPRIEPVCGRPRPSWSVILPTYCPRADYLTRAVLGVTSQLPPSADVQIEIVDDASPGFDAATFLRSIGATGVTAHRNPCRLGIAGNWNACVARAKGRWVHLLHQDDVVLPGFYAAMRHGFESAPDAGAAFCNTYFVAPSGRARLYTTVREREAGILRDWLRHVFVQLAIQTPAIVVRREVYETLGAYDEDLAYVLDWDMWKRIAARYPIWYEPEPLACYQAHRGSQTARLRRTARNVVEIDASIEASRALVPADQVESVARAARRAYSVFVLENVFTSLLRDRDFQAVLAQLAAARRLASASDFARALVRLAIRPLASLVRASERASFRRRKLQYSSSPITRADLNRAISAESSPRTSRSTCSPCWPSVGAGAP